MKINEHFGSGHTIGLPQQILRIMKLTMIIMTVFLLQVSASTKAQITLNAKKESLRKVLKAISKQSGYDFIYSIQDLEKSNPVNLEITNASIDKVLEICFEGQPLVYELSDRTVMVKKKRPSLLDQVTSVFNNIDVHGRIEDEKGQPLPGASVTVKGSNKYTTTNKNGAFTLTNVDEHAVIVISFIGYEPKELKAKANMGTTTLLMANSKLDEVQVQAYGQISRRLNTGNIGTVKAADIEKQPVTNVLLALQGRVAGLFVTQASGLPNSTVQVRIRGLNTMAQQAEPLYVIDGLPYTPTMLLNVGTKGSGQSSPLSFINPASIESVDILKDADATAIYGSRGANGVILITTKKGMSGSTKFDANVYTGISQIPAKLDLMDNTEYLTMRREAFNNDGVVPTADVAPELFTWDPNRNINWQDRLLGQKTFNTNAQVSMSGGSESTQYRAFTGYNITAPPFPGDFKSEKISAGITLTTASENKRFHAQIGVNYLADQTYLPAYDPTVSIFQSPNSPEPLNEDGSLNFTDFAYNNPMTGFKNWYKGKTNNLVANVNLSYQLMPSLTLRVTGGYNNSSVNGNAATTIAEKAGNPIYTNPTGTAQFSYNTISSWIAEPQLSYRGSLLKGNWEALLGTSFQQSKTNGQLISGSGYTNDALLNSLAAATAVSNGGSTFEQSKFNSVYGRLNYNYQDKYLLNLTGRRDGSSRFGPDKRFGNFGAAGIGWIFTKEAFISENIPLLSFGKLRASYGITGNEPGANYKYASLHTFLTPTRPYQGAQAITTDNLLYPDYRWEEVKKLEGGLELGFLKDRVLASFSYFKNNSSNQLINYQVPSITGFSTLLLNQNANVQNTGIEMTLSTVNIKSSQFSWKSDFNITFSKNKLVSFPGIENSPYSTTYVVGLPLSVQARYRAAGVDPATGVYQFYTKDGGLTFEPELADATDYTSFDPKYYGGFQNSFTYKQFGLDVFFQFVKQTGYNYLFSSESPAGQSYQGNNNQSRELLDRWQKPGDVATYQKYSAAYGDAYNAFFYQQQSTGALTDASYIRLKNIAFNYEIPASISRKLKVDKARIYFQAENLLTITPYKGLDPESQTYLPPLSLWTIGAQFTF